MKTQRILMGFVVSGVFLVIECVPLKPLNFFFFNSHWSITLELFYACAECEVFRVTCANNAKPEE